MTQVIILNMLIAIMAESHNKVTKASELVAQKGRAQLILEYESAEVARIRNRAKSNRATALAQGMQGMLFHDLLGGSDKQRLEQVCPRWLHILMPAEHQRGEDSDSPEELRQIVKLRKEVQAAEAALGARQTKMLEAVGKRDDVGERQKMMQAIRVELSQLREDVVADVRQSLLAPG